LEKAEEYKNLRYGEKAMGTIDVSLVGVLFAFLLLVIPVAISLYFKIGLVKQLLYAVFRMATQLLLVGIFLKYLFKINNPYLNVAWLSIMILVAVFSAVKNSTLRAGKIVIPAFLSFSIITFFIVIYLNLNVLRLQNLFDARYLIILGGMLLGNSLRGNIIGISSFYKNIKKDKKLFLYILSLGATKNEAIMPYLRDAIQLAMRPTFASMATMGIVALPGMMTGVILGGADLQTAIKYQIIINLSIVVSTITSITFTILMTLKVAFNSSGLLKEDIFSK
jgi:putative ABC transport system permease protein